MYDVSYEYESAGEPVAGKDNATSKNKTRKEYPCLYIRGKDIPEMDVGDDGMGTATIKFRIIGYREPNEGEKTLELEVHEISSEDMAEEKTENEAEGESGDSSDELNETLEDIAKSDKNTNSEKE